MDTLSSASALLASAGYQTGQVKKADKNSYGNTIGTPELSDKAKEYYEQLKKKYSNMDFILVSEDKKEEAKANAANYANSNRMVVLIDTDKVERMASDENYRKQYEGIISGATTQMAELQTGLKSSGANVKTYGIQMGDHGTASYFAVIDKSLTNQKKRIEQSAKKHAKEEQIQEKKDKKKAEQKKLEEKRTEHSGRYEEDDGDTIMVTASSMEGLLKKIQDIMQANGSDSVQTPQEKQIGQHIDFKG